MNVLEAYQTYCQKDARYNQLIELYEESLKIIRYQNFYDLSYMDQLIVNKWKALFSQVNMDTAYLKLINSFNNLKSGYINRNQFAEEAIVYFKKVQELIDSLGASRDKCYEDFSIAYSNFFTNIANDPNIDLGIKLICTAIIQPEAKELIESFLKS